MILYASSSLFKEPKEWLRAIALVPSRARPGWSLLKVSEDSQYMYASMTPEGTWQGSKNGDGPYEQCLLRGSNLVFQPRYDGEDQVVPVILDV